MIALPSFDQLDKNYPVDADPEAVKRDIGGHADASWITNTCVLRMSKAFNYAGHKKWLIPSRDGLLTVSGADGLNYAVRVLEFVDFLRDTYGPPDIIRSGDNITLPAFAGTSGIIVWIVSGWTDARGHFTLWDGNSGRYEGSHRYFDFPTKKPDGGGAWLTKVELWRC